MAATLCPHCQTRFKLPDDRLHSKLRCPKCSETFVAEPAAPKASAPAPLRARAQRPAPARKGIQPLHVVLVLVAVGGLGALWIVMQPGSEPDPVKKTAAEAPVPPRRPAAAATVNPLEHPAMLRIKLLRTAVANYNAGALAALLEPGAFWAVEADPAEPRWTALRRDRREEYTDQLIERMFEDRGLRALAEHEPTAAWLLLEEPNALRFELRCDSVPEQIWTVDLTRVQGSWKVAGFSQRLDEAPAPGEEQSAAAAQGTLTDEEYIEQNFEQIEGGGRVFKGEVSAVEPWPGVTPEKKREMERVIAEAQGDNAIARNRAREDIAHLGPEIIPVLLNRLVALPLTDDPERVATLNDLNHLLELAAWRRSPWPMPGMTEVQDLEEIQERRQLAIAAWFGWWDRKGQRWEDWRKEVDIPAPDPRRRRR